MNPSDLQTYPTANGLLANSAGYIPLAQLNPAVAGTMITAPVQTTQGPVYVAAVEDDSFGTWASNHVPWIVGVLGAVVLLIVVARSNGYTVTHRSLSRRSTTRPVRRRRTRHKKTRFRIVSVRRHLRLIRE
jgi:hypothetical protein